MIDKTNGYNFLFGLQQVLHEHLLSCSYNLVEKHNFAVTEAKSRAKMVRSNTLTKLVTNI